MNQLDDRLEAIISYVAGELTLEQEEALEELLFSDDLLEVASDWARLADGIRRNNSRGLRHPFCTVAQAEKIRSLDLHVHEEDFGDEEVIAPLRPPPKCDVVITRYGMDLRGVSRLELDMGFDDMVVKTAAADFTPGDDAIYGCCEYGLAARSCELLAGHHGLLRAYSVEPGGRRLLREFKMLILGPAD